MSNNITTMEEFRKDPRIPCRYGVKCYQKSTNHHTKYKHPPKPSRNNNGQGPSKKMKFDDAIRKCEEEARAEKESPCIKELVSDSDSDSDQSNSKLDVGDNKVETRPAAQIKEAVSERDLNQSNSRMDPNKDSQVERTVTPVSKTESDENRQNKPSNSPKLTVPSDTTDPKEFIKEKFLVAMPEDFYLFWDYCKKINPDCPTDALKQIGLKLVGPYDVLAGKFQNFSKSDDEYLKHWRYFYDPPEFQTVLKGDDKTGFHIGYFRDSPDERPVFLASNYGLKEGTFNKMGDNIFAAVYLYLEDLKKTGDPFKKMSIPRYSNSIKAKAEVLNMQLSQHTENTKKRESKVVARTKNRLGLIVPYNKKSQVGYRGLVMSDKDIITLLDKLKNAAPEQKAKCLSDLQPVFTYASIAIDECDFGTGIKLGWDILCHGVGSLNSTISRFLSTSYRLLNKGAFARIAEVHMNDRKKSSNLSIL